jgi:hypothetical protein
MAIVKTIRLSGRGMASFHIQALGTKVRLLNVGFLLQFIRVAFQLYAAGFQ